MTTIEIAVGLMGVTQPILIGLVIRSLSRLTAIEVALGIRETPDAREGRRLQQQRQSRHVCAGPHECYYKQPQGQTNPRIPIYDPNSGGDSVA